jgi:K+-transporting ATPase ATPase B chain
MDGQQLRKGAGDAVIEFVKREGGSPPPELQEAARPHRPRGRHAAGGRRDSQVLGVIYLKDTIKEGMKERFDQLRAMGIRTSWSPATTA